MRPPQTFGKYLLLDRISMGGMAEVFKAKSFGVEGFEKIIAIKRILPSMAEDADFVAMFIDEAKIAGQLSHANICQIFELGKIGDAHFIAMEYIWGKDLLQISNRFRKLRQPMPIPLACYVAAKVCEGLDYAHRKRDAQGRPLAIIHRDVSPQNVLVSYEGEVKLIDFGIAKAAVRSSRTQHGILKGKFGYMSPEQVRGLPLDRRSDLFAIGTLLWECLCGERLFAGDSDFATLEQVRDAAVTAPSRKNRAVPPELDRIVLKALASDTNERYQWANAIQDDLQQVLVRFEPVFTAKQLSAWMKDAFAADLERERRELEAQKRLPPPPTDGEDSTIVSAPPFAGRGAQGFSDEGPTEIFGEIESHDSFLSADAPVTGRRREPATPVPVSSDSGLAMVMPLPAPAAPHVIAPLPTAPTLPLRPPAPEPASTPPPAASVPLATAPIPKLAPITPRPSPRAGRGPTLYLAVAVGLVVLATSYLLGARLLGRRPEPSLPVLAATTLVVTTSDRGEGAVWVDGVYRGRVAGEPLPLQGLPPGEHDVVCKRTGAADSAQRVALDPRGATVVTCRFQVTQTGTLLLNVVTEGATVLVDKQEITSVAAKEPLILEAGKEHEIVVQKDGYHPQTLTLTLHPEEPLPRTVELSPIATPKPPRRPRERPSPEPKQEVPAAAAPAAPDDNDEQGYLIVESTPWARVWIDGRDTGKMTPITAQGKLPVSAGKHKVTFVVGNKQFTYTVMVEPGQDYTLSRQLPVGN